MREEKDYVPEDELRKRQEEQVLNDQINAIFFNVIKIVLEYRCASFMKL